MDNSDAIRRLQSAVGCIRSVFPPGVVPWERVVERDVIGIRSGGHLTLLSLHTQEIQKHLNSHYPSLHVLLRVLGGCYPCP